MCPNCILNSAAVMGYIGPGLICLGFLIIAAYFLYQGARSGEFAGDEEEAKYAVFEE